MQKMEGLIPFVYRAIVQYKNGGEGFIGPFLHGSSSPSASYMRLPAAEFQILQQDRGFSSACSSPSTTTKRIVTSKVQSPPPGRYFTSRHAIN